MRRRPGYLGNARLLAVLKRGHCRRTDIRGFRRIEHPHHQTPHDDTVFRLGARLRHHRLHLLEFAGNVPNDDLRRNGTDGFYRPPSLFHLGRCSFIVRSL